MVFQIADDALDLLAKEEAIGKPAGSDIREGTFTAPVLLAAAGPDGDRIRALLDTRPYTEEAVAEVIRLVRTGKYVEASLEEAKKRLHVATAALEDLPEGTPQGILEKLGDFLLDRVEAARS